MMSYRLFRTGAALAAGTIVTLGAGGAWAAPFECPYTGGDMVFGQEAKVNSLDMHASSAISSRNIALNMYESLMTRSEQNDPIPELAASVETSDDGLTHTFRLREGVSFHNGKPMTSADVVASFNRYKRLGVERGMLDKVASWEAPDDHTFIINMSEAQATFLEALSSFTVPIVIMPAENEDAPPLQAEPVGTGPFEFVEFVADSHVKLARYDGYVPNDAYEDRTGFGGYKVACFDTVTFRIITEAGARVAGIETGELQGVEDVPTTTVPTLRDNPDVTILPFENFWVQLATPNFSKPPTDNLMVRRAIQTALDMEEIMEAATDGAYSLDYGFQAKGRFEYCDAGSQYFNVNDKDLARQYLQEAGYNGEELVLLTNRDYGNMYTSALIVSEQLKEIGMNVRLEVQDWPTTIATRDNIPDVWNYFFTGLGTQTAVGALAVARTWARPTPVYNFGNPDDTDEEFDAHYVDMLTLPTREERREAFCRAQERMMEAGLALPFGWLTKIQAVRSNVENFVPFRIPRMYNVYFSG